VPAGLSERSTATTWLAQPTGCIGPFPHSPKRRGGAAACHGLPLKRPGLETQPGAAPASARSEPGPASGTSCCCQASKDLAIGQQQPAGGCPP